MINIEYQAIEVSWDQKLLGRSVPENGIESRVLKLAIPEGATQSQQDQLKRLIDYAQQNNVQLNIVLAK